MCGDIRGETVKMNLGKVNQLKFTHTSVQNLKNLKNVEKFASHRHDCWKIQLSNTMTTYKNPSYRSLSGTMDGPLEMPILEALAAPEVEPAM